MKKFDRLPPEQRKEEIQAAALQLFYQKGFAATTMENIVERVSLSKGGVYRLYPSTAAILSDLMLAGMHLRNDYYAKRVQQEIADGMSLSLPFLIDMIVDSLLIYPEFSSIYVEFLWEKQRNPELETVYGDICNTSIDETVRLIQTYGADDLLLTDRNTLKQLTDLMNAAVLSLKVLGLEDQFRTHKSQLCAAVACMLNP